MNNDYDKLSRDEVIGKAQELGLEADLIVSLCQHYYDLGWKHKGLWVREEFDSTFEDVVLWGVHGIGGTFYGTKELAERAARVAFPEEDPHKRYARIFYRVTFKERT